MKEKEILQKAMQQLTAITGVTMLELPVPKIHHADAMVQLGFGKREYNFYVEIKAEIRHIHLPRFLEHVKEKPKEWLLVCQYIPQPVKENLKAMEINYLETAGNCFINKGELFLYINDKITTPHRRPKEGKLWKPAGLKFLFIILQKPEMLNKPYRNIAKAANIALGNIGTFIDELKEEGFLKKGKDNILFLENKEQLQKRWIELFNGLLKPKLRQGRFRFLDRAANNNWRKLPVDKIYWGGETAGALLTDFLEPEVFTIYTRQPKTEIMKQLKLVPDKNGNVEVMDMFWHPEITNLNDHKVVPSLLAYAELITNLDSRNRETAERIKQKYLA